MLLELASPSFQLPFRHDIYITPSRLLSLRWVFCTKSSPGCASHPPHTELASGKKANTTTTGRQDGREKRDTKQCNAI